MALCPRAIACAGGRAGRHQRFLDGWCTIERAQVPLLAFREHGVRARAGCSRSRSSVRRSAAESPGRVTLSRANRDVAPLCSCSSASAHPPSGPGLQLRLGHLEMGPRGAGDRRGRRGPSHVGGDTSAGHTTRTTIGSPPRAEPARTHSAWTPCRDGRAEHPGAGRHPPHRCVPSAAVSLPSGGRAARMAGLGACDT